MTTSSTPSKQDNSQSLSSQLKRTWSTGSRVFLIPFLQGASMGLGTYVGKLAVRKYYWKLPSLTTPVVPKHPSRSTSKNEKTSSSSSSKSNSTGAASPSIIGAASVAIASSSLEAGNASYLTLVGTLSVGLVLSAAGVALVSDNSDQKTQKQRLFTSVENSTEALTDDSEEDAVMTSNSNDKVKSDPVIANNKPVGLALLL